MEYKVRTARPEDVIHVLHLLKELAEYEKAPQEVTLTVEKLSEDAFGDNKIVSIELAEDENQVIVGIAMYYYAYSTWKGRCLFLEDLVVKESLRGQGIGKLLFNRMIEISYQTGAQRMMWQVLNWNRPAIDFYKKYDAQISDEWLNGRFNREQIESLYTGKE
jgi:GNAT superfamily N-acetyltransferase